MLTISDDQCVILTQSDNYDELTYTYDGCASFCDSIANCYYFEFTESIPQCKVCAAVPSSTGGSSDPYDLSGIRKTGSCGHLGCES
jgi:hypothetical protein